VTLFDRILVTAAGRLRVPERHADELRYLQDHLDAALYYLAERDLEPGLDRFGRLTIRAPCKITRGERMDLEREVDTDTQLLLERWLAQAPDASGRKAMVEAKYAALGTVRGVRPLSWQRWHAEAAVRAFGPGNGLQGLAGRG
jgi:hypothetical protein